MSLFLTTEQPTTDQPRAKRRNVYAPRHHADAYERDWVWSVIMAIAILGGIAWGGYHILRALAEWTA